ncbi:MAG: glycerol-3-phosphate acyltransferase [Chloroflexi bacterium]|nr:glycerol-3-phosphate acyltransferase [Chloroflexota bacterium]
MVIKIFLVLLGAYMIGSVPIGWLIVKLFNGKDIRTLGSGRIGGTNVMRAAGFVAGLLTSIFDAGKGVLVGFLATLIIPESLWVKIIAVVLAVVGQIFSVFLIEKHSNGKIQLHGGAGGSTTLGGAIALWPFSWVVILPLIILVYIGIGYASVTTISIAFFSLLLFGYRAAVGFDRWELVFYGISTLGIVLYALRPNLKRLKEGTERAVGLRAYFKKKLDQSRSQNH